MTGIREDHWVDRGADRRRRRGLVPEPGSRLESFLERQDFYGRDVIAEVLAGVAGADALQVLLRASAGGLGDDQDTLQTVVCDVLEDAPERARPVVLELVDRLGGAGTPRP